MSGAWKSQDGGERAAMPLMYGSNNTVKTHSGYEVIDTTPQDGMTTAFYEWAEIAGSISISRKEERQNAGEGRLLNLLESKIKQAEMSMREEMNVQLVFGENNNTTETVPSQSVGGTDGLNPLGYLISKSNSTNPNRGGNIGNISRANTWWRHNTADLSAGAAGNTFNINVSTWKGLSVALKRMYNYCARGSGGPPDLAVFDQTTFEEYESGLDDKVRYQNTKMADQGFDNIKLRGATCIWDEQVPDMTEGLREDDASTYQGSAFFLNTDFYNIIYDSQTGIVTTPFIEPENQTAKTAKILFMGQACSSNQRKHGLCFEILYTIVA
eukprot:GHVO01041572.1.p1 GENE.GHVO01041572.1~~GHVO01041572.1.p1  ORF type:complete len:372 (+),score=28.98 GHVO01041572.1:141-1118(+)